MQKHVFFESTESFDLKSYSIDLDSAFQKYFTDCKQSLKNEFSSSEQAIRSAIETKSKNDLLIAISNLTDFIVDKYLPALAQKRFDVEKQVRTKLYKNVDFSKQKPETLLINNKEAFVNTEAFAQIKELVDDWVNILTSELKSSEFVQISDIFNIQEVKDNLLKSFAYADAEFQSSLNNAINALNKVFSNVNSEIDVSTSKPQKQQPHLIKNVSREEVFSKDEVPDLLMNLAEKLWKKLPDLDKNILLKYQNSEKFTNYVVGNSDNLITKTATNDMTNEGIVLLCGLAMNKLFPENEDSGEYNDIVLKLDKLVYKGGKSKAVIHYGQPKETQHHDDNGNLLGSDVNKQFFELRINPEVRIKNSKGACEFLIRTSDKEDETKLVTNRSQRVPVWECFKVMFTDYDLNDDDRGGKRRRY